MASEGGWYYHHETHAGFWESMRKLQTLVTGMIYVEVQSVQYGNSGVLLEPFGGSTCIGWSGWLTKRSRDAYDLLKKKRGVSWELDT